MYNRPKVSAFAKIEDFITIERTLLMKKILFSLLMCVMLVGIGSNSLRAQGCPPDTVPHPGSSWIGPSYEFDTIPGTSCVVIVGYCHRTDSVGIKEFIITSVSIPDSLACSSLTPDSLIRGA